MLTGLSPLARDFETFLVERTVAWLHRFGRPRRRLDRGTELQDAFLPMACALICLRFVADT